MKGVTINCGDVLLNITGDSVARCCVVPDNALPARVNQHVAIIRVDSNVLDSDFLMFYLTSPSMQSKLLSWAGTGGTRKALTKSMIEGFEVPTPELHIQKNISKKLRSYSDLIENNRRRIQLLEEFSRLIYKEWFVHLRFPGHEHVKIEDGVPAGWSNGSIGDLAEVKSGFSFKSKDWLEDGNPVIKIKNITESGEVNIAGCQCVDDSVAEKAKKFEVFAGDFLIAMTGATVGKVGIMPRNNRRYYLNQRVGNFSSKTRYSCIPFLFCFSRSGFFKKSISNLAGGAAQPNISGGQIESIEVLVPDNKVLGGFFDSVESIFQQREILLEQNNQLAKARDLLLPRLMNGDLAV